MYAARVSLRDSRQATTRPNERALVTLWRNAYTLAEALVTEDGRRLRVVYPGRLSARAGPDFRDSVLATETGELLTGDVELHLGAPDWDRHGHHLDPNYNGVILHVVLSTKGRKTSQQQSKATVPVASLGPLAGLLGSVESLCGRGPALWPGLEGKRLEELLDLAGDHRFHSRSRGFVLEMEAADAEEALYGALMEGLGYASNRKPFRELARYVPLAVIRGLSQEPRGTRLLALKAMLLNAAGLLSVMEAGKETVRLSALLKHLPKTKNMGRDRWQLFRVRPSNHPARRVAGAAHLLDRYIEAGLLRGLAKDVCRDDARFLVQRMTVRSFIGRGRAGELVINVVLPFMHAWAGLRRDHALRTRCLELYRAFPAPQDNEITREAKRLLSARGEAVVATSARRHQGLIHLYRFMTGRVPV